MRFARKLALLFALAALPAAAAQAQSADEHFRSSRARAQSGDFAGAIIELDKAVARGRDFAEPYQARAGLKLMTKDLEGVLADLNRPSNSTRAPRHPTASARNSCSNSGASRGRGKISRAASNSTRT